MSKGSQMKRKREESAANAPAAKIRKKTFIAKPAKIIDPPHVPLGLRKPEKKTVDQLLNSQFDTTGTVTALCIPATGAGPNQRIGRETELDNLYITGFCGPTGSGTTAIQQDYARLMVVYDRSPVGSNPSIADIITSLNAAGGTSSTAVDGLNLNNKRRFVVLMDERIILPGVTGTTGGAPTLTAGYDQSQSLSIKRFIKLNGLRQEYKASTPAVADLTTGALFLVQLSELTAAGSTTVWKFFANARLSFRDA